MSGNELEFSGKRAVITGGTQGLGFEVAKLLATQGAELFLSYRSQEAKAAAAREELLALGAKRVVTGAFDLTEVSAIQGFWVAVAKFSPQIDIYIHNAAATAFKPLLQIEPHHIDKTFNLTVKSFVMALKALRGLMPAGGAIVTVSGMDTLRAVPLHGLLGSAKAALENLTAHAAHELGPFGIRVNGVNPGFFDSESTRKYLGPAVPLVHAAVSNQSPFQRLPELREIADVILFLASKRSSWICGQTLKVDGGADFSMSEINPAAAGASPKGRT